jgi:hypothetical protein
MALAVVQVPGAGAQDLLACTGRSVTRFSPGLLLMPQRVTISYVETLDPCGLDTGSPAVTSGRASETVSDIRNSCLNVTLGPGSKTFTWSTGERSRFEFTIGSVDAGGQVIVTDTGTITDGKFQGARAVELITIQTLSSLRCFEPPGIEDVTGEIVLTITPI